MRCSPTTGPHCSGSARAAPACTLPWVASKAPAGASSTTTNRISSKVRSRSSPRPDLSSSLGLLIGKDGQLIDAIPGSPAYAAGLAPGMKLIAVNGRRWTPGVLNDALSRARQTRQPIEVLAETGDFFKTYQISDFEGSKIPHLERIQGAPDLLTGILAPKTGPTSP